jgi:L-rhamnose-H+ transport protein
MLGTALGVILHAIGGFAAGSFYIPFRKVARWAWESYWLIQGVLAWVIAPWVMASITCPDLVHVLRSATPKSLILAYLFGAIWGIGGLTFGLSMRYLGMSLGYAVALGFCAAFGTLVPPIADGTIREMVATPHGLAVIAGVAVCLLGIAFCGWAGMTKERELTDEQKTETIREFSFAKGFAVAVFAGIASAFMAFALQAGKPIAELAIRHGSATLYQNNPVFIVVMAGGFTTNFIWCAILNSRNRTWGDYLGGPAKSQLGNYFFAGLAGVIWYCQFFFYGMGTTKMGKYDFSSWTIHMAFIIVFSNLWGILFREWKGTSKRTHALVWTGIGVLVLSTVVVGYGNYLKAMAGS